MNDNSGLLQRLSDSGVDFVVVGGIAGGGDFDQVQSSAIEVELLGHKVKVMGLEALIRTKEAVGRQKDLLAASELRAISARTKPGK